MTPSNFSDHSSEPSEIRYAKSSPLSSPTSTACFHEYGFEELQGAEAAWLQRIPLREESRHATFLSSKKTRSDPSAKSRRSAGISSVARSAVMAPVPGSNR